MSNPLLVGADVHRKTNTLCLMDREGQEVGPRFTVDNNRPGTEAFIQQIAQQVVAGDYDAIHIAAEATGWYCWHFFQTLAHDPFLKCWPVELYPFNPRLTANFKKTYVVLDHTDPIDAFVVADRLRLDRDLPAPFHYEERYFPVRLLTRYRYHLVHNLTREKAYCLAILYLKASEYTRQDKKPFSSVFGAVSRAVIQEFASMEETRFHLLLVTAYGRLEIPSIRYFALLIQQVVAKSASENSPTDFGTESETSDCFLFRKML